MSKGLSISDVVFRKDAIAKDISIKVDDVEEKILIDVQYLASPTVSAIIAKNKKKGEDLLFPVTKKGAIASLKKWNFSPRHLSQVVPIDLPTDGKADLPMTLDTRTLDQLFEWVPSLAYGIVGAAQDASNFPEVKQAKN